MSKDSTQNTTDRLAATLLALALKVKKLKSVDDLKNFASKNEFEAQAQDGQLGTYEYGGHPIILLKYAGVVHEFVDHEMISGWLDKKVQITPGTGSTGTEAQNKVLIKIGEHVYATSLDQLQDFVDLDNAVVNNQMAISGNKAQIALLKAFARYLGTITGNNAADISKAPATRPDGTAFQDGDYIILKYGLPISNPGDAVKYVFQEFVWETDKFVPLGEAQAAHPHASPGFLLKEIKDTPTYAAGADASAIGSINIDRTKFNEIKNKDNVILDLDVSGITPKDNSQFNVIQDDGTYEKIRFSSGDIAEWSEVKDKIATHSMLLEKDGNNYFIRGWVLKPKVVLPSVPTWKDVTATYKTRTWTENDLGKKVKISTGDKIYVGLISSGNDTLIKNGKIVIDLGIDFTDTITQNRVYYSSEHPSNVGYATLKVDHFSLINEEGAAITKFEVEE